MLRISSYFRYGTRCLVILALKSEGFPVTLKSLAAHQGISKKYLEAVFRSLRKNGIVRGIKGHGGGYELCESPDKITLLDVLKAVEGPVRLIDCTETKSACTRADRCPTRSTWGEFEEYISKFLKNRTIQDLVDDYGYTDETFQGMYI